MKLLLIDDDSASLESLKKILCAVGYECTVFTDPFKGLNAFRINHFDVVITDIMMLGISGIELLDKILGCNPRAYVIVITGFLNTEPLLPMIKEKAFAFFRKPLKIKEIINKLNEIDSKQSKTLLNK